MEPLTEAAIRTGIAPDSGKVTPDRIDVGQGWFWYGAPGGTDVWDQESDGAVGAGGDDWAAVAGWACRAASSQSTIDPE